jgi:hypothetical protein
MQSTIADFNTTIFDFQPAVFSFATNNRIICDTFPENHNPKCERSHLKKYWLFASPLRSFTRASFPARNPLTYAHSRCELFSRLLL